MSSVLQNFCYLIFIYLTPYLFKRISCFLVQILGEGLEEGQEAVHHVIFAVEGQRLEVLESHHVPQAGVLGGGGGLKQTETSFKGIVTRDCPLFLFSKASQYFLIWGNLRVQF